MTDLQIIDFEKDKIKIEEYFNEKLGIYLFYNEINKSSIKYKLMHPQNYKADLNYNEDLNIYFGTEKNIIYVGCVYGLEVISLAQSNKNFIYAFEPLYYNYCLLKQNIIMNKATNVIPYQAFVGNDNCFEVYHNTDDSHLSLLGFNDEIPVLRLDDYDFEDIGLIYFDHSQMKKIDDGLKGSVETIKKHNPEIIIDTNLDSPTRFLQKLGYKDVGLEYNQRGGRFIKD